jgi:hypothetical protein
VEVLTTAALLAAHIERSAELFAEVVRLSMRIAADAAEAEAKKLAPPGIARTIVGIAEDANFALETDHRAAIFVEAGTRAHIIEGRLAFEIAGSTIFARRVHHPGNKAAPYMRPGVDHGAHVFFQSMAELFPS